MMQYSIGNVFETYPIMLFIIHTHCFRPKLTTLTPYMLSPLTSALTLLSTIKSNNNSIYYKSIACHSLNTVICQISHLCSSQNISCIPTTSLTSHCISLGCIPQISTKSNGELRGVRHGSNPPLFDCSINSILSEYFSFKY